ncbi:MULTISPECIES: YceI family protein [unclassified Paracoccus (in: a-proteobacteria)]|uniref:YceI family protein n=1 Tax=unclassified Paracoccus (in: a-proteobacteria) TaxID=2688777 RepID=UPI0012B1D855|nr:MULTISPECIES: YceI family protein [unclassified Paracoccus (in: a-proteobacteria)]UXU73742.1 YceI family protein [Paracoccus sp. SMMA_5]UXU79632.1 YceI family protein [Paracoccus sp. SMMA_5_TC]
MTRLLLVAAGFVLTGATLAQAAPETYEFDPDHSQAVFRYNHMGFSTSTGFVAGITGRLVIDPEAPENATVEATIPLSGLRTLSPELDKHLFGPDFFDTDPAQAVAEFRSTRVEPDGGDEARVTGELTLNGVTRTVVLEVDLNKRGPHPMTKKEAIGFDAEARIRRTEFNLGKFAPAVGDEIEIDISVEAIKAQ